MRSDCKWLIFFSLCNSMENSNSVDENKSVFFVLQMQTHTLPGIKREKVQVFFFIPCTRAGGLLFIINKRSYIVFY